MIELLAVLTLFAMAAIAVATTAAGGLRVYQRARYQSGLQTDLLIGLQRFEAELHSAFVFDTIGFDGQNNRLSFPALVRRWNPFHQTFDLLPGRVAYRLDTVDGALLRLDQDYSQATAPGGSRIGEERLLATGVDSFDLKYLVYDQEIDAFVWHDSWQSDDRLPAAVGLRLKASAPGGIVDFTRTLTIHAGMPPWTPPAEDDRGVGVVR